MGRKKKNNFSLNEINELNELHLMNTNNEKSVQVVNDLDSPINSDNNQKSLDNTTTLAKQEIIDIPEKKKRGRKKKVVSEIKLQSTEIFSKRKDIGAVIGDDEQIENKKTISDDKNKKSSSEEKLTNSDDGKNELFKELLTKQLKNICPSKKLQFNDIKRISKFLAETIFDENKCSLWNGYITNEKNQHKGTYINFYFNKKKIALHRLLYINYIGDITNDEYIKFSCENKGKCCTIAHMKKYTYTKSLGDNEQNDNSSSSSTYNTTKKNVHISSLNKNKFTVEF